VEKKKYENIAERIPYLIVPVLSSLVFLWNGITQIIGISENPQSIFSFLLIIWGIGMIFWMLHWIFDIAKKEAKVFNTLYCLLASLCFLLQQIIIMLFSHY
jgi:hypothetical protein